MSESPADLQVQPQVIAPLLGTRRDDLPIQFCSNAFTILDPGAGQQL